MRKGAPPPICAGSKTLIRTSADYTILNKALLDHTHLYTSSESIPSLTELSSPLLTSTRRRRVVATAEIFGTYVECARIIWKSLADG